MLKHKNADRRRQIAPVARTVNSSNQFRQRHAFEMSDFFELAPESIFKADAGFVSIKYDGALNDQWFHEGPQWPPLPHSSFTAIPAVAEVLNYRLT